jgi:hypothetical protein
MDAALPSKPLMRASVALVLSMDFSDVSTAADKRSNALLLLVMRSVDF